MADRRELYDGFGDGMSRAFELVATPLIFGFLGHLADGWLGTGPVLLAAASVTSVVGIMYVTWVRYEADMRREEEAVAERRRRRRASAPLVVDAGSPALEAASAGAAEIPDADEIELAPWPWDVVGART